jgi:hypothetical protein
LHAVVDELVGRPGPLAERWPGRQGHAATCARSIRSVLARAEEERAESAALDGGLLLPPRILCDEALRTHLARAGLRPGAQLDALATVLLARQVELWAHFSGGAARARIGGCALRDIDWVARVALGGDRASRVRVPLLALDLRLEDSDGRESTATLELNEHELDALLDALTEAERALGVLR